MNREDKIFKTIGKRLEHFRNLKNLKRKEVADKAGISDTFYGRIEKGEKVSIPRLYDILDILEVSPADFFEGDSDEKKNSTSLLMATA